MSKAVTVSGSTYTVRGAVRDQSNNQPVVGIHVIAYDKDLLSEDDFLGIATTSEDGGFEISFEASAFRAPIFDRKPDLYFSVKDGGTEVLNTKDHVLRNAGPDTPPILLEVDLSADKLRQDINPTPVPGWVGGFSTSNKEFAYPEPNLTSLPMLHNLDNIDKLQRQQKVLWPEFSWLSEPGEADPKRCYQMFAPDISRLGYTDEGRVYAIICPQQGIDSPTLGAINVEVTVTGTRGWANESDKTLAADMTVMGQIWFSPGAHQNRWVKKIWQHFADSEQPFPSTKADAIKVSTYKPKDPSQEIFPLLKGETKEFPVPEFARHTEIAWTVGHLGVEIGPIEKTGVEMVDEFNQLILDVFNMGAGNMLKNGTVLTWDVWFTAPELVDQQEWADHAEKWRKSIDADHGSPDGDGSTARYYDGTPFKPIEALAAEEMSKVLAFIEKHL